MNLVPPRRRVRASVGTVNLIQSQNKGCQKRRRPYNFEHIEYTQCSKLTPDGDLSAQAAFEEKWSLIAEASPYSKKLRRRTKQVKKLDSEKLARKATSTIVKTMLEQFPDVDSSNQPVGVVANTVIESKSVRKLGRNTRKELLSTYEQPVGDLLAWCPEQGNTMEQDDINVIKLYSETAASKHKEIRQVVHSIEEKSKDMMNQTQKQKTSRSIADQETHLYGTNENTKSQQGQLVNRNSGSNPSQSVGVKQEANEMYSKDKFAKGNTQKLSEQSRSSLEPGVSETPAKQSTTHQTTKPTTSNVHTTTTLSVSESDQPKLINAVLECGNAPKMYSVDRKPAPIRQPPAMAKLAAFFQRNPSCVNGPAQYLLSDENQMRKDSEIQTRHRSTAAQQVRYAGDDIASNQVTTATIAATAKTLNGVEDKNFVITKEKVKQNVSFMVHRIPIQDSKLQVSQEMQRNLKALLLANVGNGMWDDRVTSTLACPLSARDYCFGEKSWSHMDVSVKLNKATLVSSDALNIDAEKSKLLKQVHVVETSSGTALSVSPEELNAALKKQYKGMQAQVSQVLEPVQFFPFAPEAHQAAAKVQRCWQHRSAFRRTRVCRIQAVTRGHLCRLALERVRIEKVYSAILIQSVARGLLGKRLAAYYRHATVQARVTKCQSAVRRAQARRRTTLLRRQHVHRMAARVQAGWRGHQGRQRAAACRRRKEAGAATVVTRFVRMAGDRSRYLKARKHANRNATMLQRNVRVMEARRRIERMHWAASHIQALHPGMKARRLFRREYPLYAGTRGVQRLFRGMNCRRRLVQVRQRRKAEEELRLSKEQVVLDEAIRQAEMKVKTYLKTKEGKQELKEGVVRAKKLIKEQEAHRKSISSEEGRRKYDAKLAFDMFDMDDSGFIDKGELEAVMRQLLAPLTAKQLDNAMSEMDSDNSGSICIDEFEEWYCSPNRKQETTSMSIKLIKFKLEALKRIRDLTGQTPVVNAKRVILNRECKKARDEAKESYRKQWPLDYWYHILYGELRMQHRRKYRPGKALIKTPTSDPPQPDSKGEQSATITKKNTSTAKVEPEILAESAPQRVQPSDNGK